MSYLWKCFYECFISLLKYQLMFYKPNHSSYGGFSDFLWIAIFCLQSLPTFMRDLLLISQTCRFKRESQGIPYNHRHFYAVNRHMHNGPELTCVCPRDWECCPRPEGEAVSRKRTTGVSCRRVGDEGERSDGTDPLACP